MRSSLADPSLYMYGFLLHIKPSCLTDHPRLEYLRQLLDYHVRSLGQEVIRADPQHSLLCGAGADPSEESVALLSEPISMIIAQFGTSIPVGSKFKVRMDQHLHTCFCLDIC